MANTIKLKYSNTAGNAPTLTDGEIGVNQADGKLFWRNNGGVVQSVVLKRTRTINFVIDGGGSVITTGSKGGGVIDFACTIQSWTIFGDVSGSAVVDVKRATYANFPTTTSIAGSEKPTLSSAQKNQDNTLSTWTTGIAAGDILEFNVESASTVKRLTISLKVIEA